MIKQQIRTSILTIQDKTFAQKEIYHVSDDGKWNGKYEMYINSKLAKETTYKDDELHGIERAYANYFQTHDIVINHKGKIDSIEYMTKNWIDGQENGMRGTYLKSGGVIEDDIVNGNIHGYKKVWSKNKETTNYKNEGWYHYNHGIRSGLDKIYYPDPYFTIKTEEQYETINDICYSTVFEYDCSLTADEGELLKVVEKINNKIVASRHMSKTDKKLN